MPTKLSANIKELRKSMGLTQAELAKKLHKAGSTVRMWELDKASPDAEILLELSSIFNVSTDYLLSNNEPVAVTDGDQILTENKQITRINKDLKHLNHKQLKLVRELVREISHSDSQ